MNARTEQIISESLSEGRARDEKRWREADAKAMTANDAYLQKVEAINAELVAVLNAIVLIDTFVEFESGGKYGALIIKSAAQSVIRGWFKQRAAALAKAAQP